MNPKELFLKKEDLRGQLASVIGTDWFNECIAYTVAQMHDDHAMTADEMRGVKMFLQTFRQMHQKEDVTQEPLSTGLKPVPILKR